MRISGAESRIMDALWRRGPSPVDEIIADAAPGQGWSDATVKALIGRLLKKGALESVREGGRVRYRPLVARDDYLAAESQGFLDRMFGGFGRVDEERADRKSSKVGADMGPNTGCHA